MRRDSAKVEVDVEMIYMRRREKGKMADLMSWDKPPPIKPSDRIECDFCGVSVEDAILIDVGEASVIVKICGPCIAEAAYKIGRGRREAAPDGM